MVNIFQENTLINVSLYQATCTFRRLQTCWLSLWTQHMK